MIADQAASSNNADCLPANSSKTRPKRANCYAEARELQLLVLKDAQDPNVTPFVRAQLVRAFKELTELRLRLQGKGPPKAVDYSEKRRKKTTARSGFLDLPADEIAKLEAQSKPPV